MNNLRKKEKFSIRKFSVGIASILIGSSMLMTYPQVNLPTVQAKEKIEVEANTDISLTVRETNEETTIELLALKDLTNVDVKVTLDGVKVITYHIDSLKAGQKQERVISKAELQSIKNNIKNKKVLPNTAVVRKDISKKFSITGGELGVGVSYDVEEGTTEIKPEKPTKPNKPEKPAEPSKPEKPTEPSKPEIPVYETADGENVTLNEDKTRAVFGDNDNSTPVKVDAPTAALEKDVARLEVEKVDVPNVDNTNNDIYNIKFSTKSGEKRQIKQPVKVEIPVEKEVEEAYRINKDGSGKESLPFKNVAKDNKKHVEIVTNELNLIGIKYKEETVKPEDEEITISDANLRKLINKNIDSTRDDNQKITRKEIESLKEINMRDKQGNPILEASSLKETADFKFVQTRGIKTLAGLENAINLEKLDLAENEISDLSPISKLTKLTKLSLFRNRISDLKPISELTNLEYLDLYANKLVDISPLEKLVNLKHLDLHNNNDQTGDSVHPTVSGGIKDISVVKNLTKLELLSLGSNNISDISAIKNLDNIKDLVLGGNHISDYSGLEQYIADRLAKQLEGEGSMRFDGQRINYDKTIDVAGTTVSVESPFKGINELGEKLAKVFENDEPINLFSEVTTNVEGVSATYNPETSKFDFTFTEEFLNKNQGKVVPVNLKLSTDDYVWRVNNIKFNIGKKERFKDKVLADKFKGKDLSGIENLTNLTKLEINGEYNDIKDIAPIVNLTKLKELSLENVKIKDISALSKLTNLRSLNIAGPFIDSEYSDAQNPVDYVINNIDALKKLTNLETLSIANRGITDINALSGLTKLNDVVLSGNNIADISALKNLT